MKKTRVDYLILLLSALFMGGSSGPMSVGLVLILSLLYGYRRQDQKLSSFFEANQKVTFGVLITITAAFVILYQGPGNRIRERFFEEIFFAPTLVLNIKLTLKILIEEYSKMLPILLIGSLPFLSWLKIKGPLQVKASVGKVYGMAAKLFVLIYIFQLPVTYKTQDIIAYRGMFFVSILFLGFAILCVRTYGGLLDRKYLNKIIFSALSVALLFATYLLVDQYNQNVAYARSYDQRTIELLNDKSSASCIETRQLERSTYLPYSKITLDTGHHYNRHLQIGLGLSRPVCLKEEL